MRVMVRVELSISNVGEGAQDIGGGRVLERRCITVEGPSLFISVQFNFSQFCAGRLLSFIFIVNHI